MGAEVCCELPCERSCEFLPVLFSEVLPELPPAVLPELFPELRSELRGPAFLGLSGRFSRASSRNTGQWRRYSFQASSRAHCQASPHLQASRIRLYLQPG